MEKYWIPSYFLLDQSLSFSVGVLLKTSIFPILTFSHIFPSLENILFLQGLGDHKDFISYQVDIGHLQTCVFNNTTTWKLGCECSHWELFLSTFSCIQTRITPNTDTFYAVYPFVKTADFDVPENHFLQMVAKKFFFTWLAMKLTSCFSWFSQDENLPIHF